MVSSMSLSEVVSSHGRFIAANTARGAARPVPRTPSGAQRPPCLPASSLPPSLPRPGQARLRRQRGRLLAALSHAAAGLCRKSRRRPRLPGGRGHFARRPRAGHHRPRGHRLLGVAVARDWLGRRGVVTLALTCGEAPGEAWERGLTPGSPDLRAGGDRQRGAAVRACYL